MASKRTSATKSPSRGAVRESSRAFPVAAPVYYLESSALLAALLEEDAAVRALLRTDARLVTSALTFAECARGLVRARVSGRLSLQDEQAAREAIAKLERRCAVIPVSDVVLERAGRPFPAEPVRSLDAIHLASLETIGSIRTSVTVLTRDRRVRENAVQLGFAVA